MWKMQGRTMFILLVSTASITTGMGLLNKAKSLQVRPKFLNPKSIENSYKILCWMAAPPKYHQIVDKTKLSLFLLWKREHYFERTLLVPQVEKDKIEIFVRFWTLV